MTYIERWYREYRVYQLEDRLYWIAMSFDNKNGCVSRELQKRARDIAERLTGHLNTLRDVIDYSPLIREWFPDVPMQPTYDKRGRNPQRRIITCLIRQ